MVVHKHFYREIENLNKKVFPPVCNIELVMKTRDDLITDGVMDFSDTHARGCTKNLVG